MSQLDTLPPTAPTPLPPRGPWRAIGHVVWDAIYWGLFRNESFAHASNIAFAILFSLFPFMILVTGLAGYWGGAELAEAATQGTGGIFAVLPDEVAKILRPEVSAVLSTSQSRVLTIGALLLGVIVTGLVESLRMGLNYAYRSYDDRHFLIRRLEGTFFMLIGGIVILGLGFLVVVLPVLWGLLLPHAPEIGPYWSYFNRLPLVFFTFGVFMFLISAHLWLPARRQTISGVLPGILVTLALWFVAGLVFSWYLSHFSGYAKTYAGLGGAIASMLFFYIIGLIFLLGAEINHSIETLRRAFAARRAGEEAPGAA
ncbi:YihY/virulence factor BrkB family protein [Siculibacillus lacustris]|uniref:YihY/virulence factor BrkB family protein n=1 Tax=Siculibacillus lacustris TaxID=1549641 RepID=A0A4Q9VG59_9HYPH|nr:YihY/virulence factor BrkB family protein [Siculibacillus lacustris]TBW33971.1 YihY/virulence factor BrkB family protein [Siculibacillus lacustris]